MEIKRENEFILRVPRTGSMKVDAFVYAGRDVKVEESAVKQLCDAASLPGVEHAIAMPDIHHGYGVPIGSVVATRDIVVPAAVGYDVNCGMRLVASSFHAAEVDVKGLADSIRRDIPLGEGKQNVRVKKSEFEALLQGGLSKLVSIGAKGHRAWEMFDPDSERLALEKVEDRGSMEGDAEAVPPRAIERGMSQFASLGGGNHFIELQEVETVFDRDAARRLGLFEGQFTVMVHSGSRGFGHEVGGHYMKLAKQYNEKHGGNPSRELCFFPLGARNADLYIKAMNAAANFAFVNRALMSALVVGDIKFRYPGMEFRHIYDVPHNMAKFEEHHGRTLLVHRKGSTRAWDKGLMQGTPFAGLGQPVLIPGSMGTGSYVLVGVPGGAKSLFSVNHGAGRTMSRTAAAGGKGKKKKREAAISDAEFTKSMEGVYLVAEDRRSAKEEAPAAYKDIDAVIRTVTGAGLAMAVARLRPRAVLKG